MGRFPPAASHVAALTLDSYAPPKSAVVMEWQQEAMKHSCTAQMNAYGVEALKFLFSDVLLQLNG